MTRIIFAASLALWLLPVVAPAQTPPENDTCEGALLIGMEVCGLMQSGSTLYATNDYDPYDPQSGESCTGRAAPGPDVVYRADLPIGGVIWLRLEAYGGWDDALYVVTDCDDPAGSCLAGDDGPGFSEVLFTAGEAGTYYVIVDSFSGSGEFFLSGIVGSFMTEVDPVTWSSIKTLYD